jgi:hypothetical protein
MPDMLTWDEIGAPLRDDFIDLSPVDKACELLAMLKRAEATIRALAQKMADMDCPVCGGTGEIEHGQPGNDGWEIHPCPHCGKFSEPSRGHFAIDAADALHRVIEGES